MVIHQSWDTSGYTDKQNHIRDLVISPALEVIENIYQDRDFVVELVTDEFSSVCPKTGLPDFATVIIRYIPDAYLVEEKSLKLYLTSYRNLGIFQENAINKILDDFVAKVSPRWVKVIGNWKSRGGIRVNVEVEWKKS
ncbi:NADPH-dependent 7-cyano-7-deazaguanine reductase [Brevinematales bacterium NS]|nr:NADPH-dependent 7-cyano-7-deazaguanine reductase QueF [Brevinematales bacterium]QJR23207.1 NADPH-dependent 7-cyano-7-deazaguanine reductase [Brevinematales bacterium NS]